MEEWDWENRSIYGIVAKSCTFDYGERRREVYWCFEAGGGFRGNGFGFL